MTSSNPQAILHWVRSRECFQNINLIISLPTYHMSVASSHLHDEVQTPPAPILLFLSRVLHTYSQHTHTHTHTTSWFRCATPSMIEFISSNYRSHYLNPFWIVRLAGTVQPLFFFFNFYLFMIVTEREIERGRDKGRGRSRLHAQGARCGIRSLVSRIAPWAKGRRQTAAPPRDPPLFFFNTPLSVWVH